MTAGKKYHWVKNIGYRDDDLSFFIRFLLDVEQKSERVGFSLPNSSQGPSIGKSFRSMFSTVLHRISVGNDSHGSLDDVIAWVHAQKFNQAVTKRDGCFGIIK